MLNKIKPGIYSLDGYNPGNEHSPIVAVHPFFGCLADFCLKEPFRQIAKQRLPEHVDYIEKIEEIIRTHPGPIITLEEHRKLNNTAVYFSEIGRTENSYFIGTWEAAAEPNEMKWKDLMQFLKEFKGRPVELVGGYYSFIGNFGYSGCVNVTAKELQKSKIPFKVMEEAVFSKILPGIGSLLD